jgi:hypothetical protein
VRWVSGRASLGALVALACLGSALLLAGRPSPAAGERRQRGDLMISLQGGISPLRLPRRDPAPVSLHLAGGLSPVGEGLLPRVRKIEIGLPPKGTISTAGLPVCTARRLRNATGEGALAACGGALIGHGSVDANVLLPGQESFSLHAQLLAFNGPVVQGHRRFLLHGYAARPPTAIVLPFTLTRGRGRFGTTIAADLPPALGPWPRLARFQLNLGRRYLREGRRQSFLTAFCPVPPRFTAGFFSLAQIEYTLEDGRRISLAITRGCRPR